ncbi:phage tail protein [Streptomyces sp. NPDC059590]|uniref:phage tail protein n=1 Tax=Streptomyces sp. NPDC059590 TaxID=3346877 RepID=UPI0036C6FC2A
MADSVNIVVRVSNQTGPGLAAVQKDFRGLRAAALALSPALIPIAAAAVPIAAKMGAAAGAVGAFTAAVIPQIGAMKDASEAQGKYQDAVAKYGAASQQAAQAETAYLQQVRKLPPATREAAAAVSVLKDRYKSWSDSLSKPTMAPVTHSVQLLSGLFPKLSPLVRGTSAELDRFVTIAAGGVASPGFDRFMEKFTAFATGALHSATNGVVNLVRRLNEGGSGGQLAEFMAKARAVGPLVAETLTNIARAALHLLAAGGDLGVTMLNVANSMAKLVNAVPTGVISTFLQLYAAFKLARMGAAALTAVTTSAAASSLSAFIRAARFGGVGAAIGGVVQGMSRMQRAAVGLGVLGLVGVGISKLAEQARGAPPDVDRLTTSLKNLTQTGKFAGELKATFGDMDGLIDKFKSLQKQAAASKETVLGFKVPVLDDVAQWAAGKITELALGDKSLKALKDDFKSVDEALAGLASGGHADQATAAFKMFKDAARDSGVSLKDFNALFPQYKEAVAALKIEQDLTARGMGLFGEQALATKSKLDAQKASADGLRQSIQALNDVNRQGLGGMIGFEAAIDAAAKAAKENADSLRMVDGHLDLNGEKARNAASALQDLAQKTDEAAGSARESGSSWESVNAIYARGRDQLIKNAHAMGLNKTEARQLADQILKTPNKTAMLKADITDFSKKINDAKAKLTDHSIPETKRTKLLANIDEWNRNIVKARAAMESTPSKKRARLTADVSDWWKKIDQAQAKLKTTKGEKKAKLIADITDWQSKVNAAQRAIKGLPGGKKAVLFANITHWNQQLAQARQNLQKVPSSKRAELRARIADLQSKVNAARAAIASVRGKTVSINVVTTGLSAARAGLAALGGFGGFAHGGIVGAAGGGPRSNLTLVGEQGPEYVRLPYGSRVIPAGRTKTMLKAEREAVGEVAGQLRRSHFGAMAGYKYNPFEKALAAPAGVGELTGSLNEWRGRIQRVTHGSTERKLLRDLDVAGRALIKNARLQEKVNAALEKAKDKLNSLKEAAASMKESVSSGILGSANITRTAGNLPEGRTLTTADVMGGMIESRDKASSFAKALEALKKRGLNKQLLADFAQAGIEGGGLQTATALMRASGSEISRMNELQGQIGSAAKSAGTTAADAMYGAGIKTAEGVVKGLEKNKARIEKAMSGIAKALEAAIKKAIGRKATGGIIGAAGGGPRSALTLVGEQGPEVVRLPYGSSVYPAGRSRQMMRGSGHAEPVVIELRSSGSDMDEFLLKILRRAIKVRGGNAQLVLAGRAS